jgi:hypothetical protein
VLGRKPRLTQNSYREAVAETLAAIQQSDSDQDMADAWGVSAGTVANCRNRNHNLNAVPLLQMGERFGPDALGTVLRLIGAKAVPIDAMVLDVSAIPFNVAKTLPLLIQLFQDGECCDHDVRTLEKAGAIDCLGRIADMLRERRDTIRLRAVA